MIPITLFQGRKVAVFGLGMSGLATAKALAAGGAELLGELPEGQRLLIQADFTVANHVDDLPFRRGAEHAFVGDLRDPQPDLPLQFREFRPHHEEDDQQEHDVDHRRQVQCRLFVEMGLQRHGWLRLAHFELSLVV